MANAEAMRLSNKAIWGDSVLDAFNYYIAGQGLTLEQRENNMARRENSAVTYQIAEVENGFVLTLPEPQYGANVRYVFNSLTDLNKFLTGNNQQVFINK